MGCFEPVTCTVLHVHVNAHDVHVHEYPWMVIAGYHVGCATPVFLCLSRNYPLDFREHRDLHRPCVFDACAICRSIYFLPDRHPAPQNLQRPSGFLLCRFLLALTGPGICSSSFLLYRNLENGNVGCPHPGVLATKLRYFGIKSTNVRLGVDGHQTC